MTRRWMVLLAVVAIALTGCGSKNKVGDKSLLNIGNQVQQELGKRTTTSQAVTSSTQAPQSAALGAKSTTTTARPTATTAPANSYEIAINGDTDAPPGFDPQDAKVIRGTIVTWVNHDKVKRSVTFDDGSYNSGDIAPGGKATYQARTAGTFSYSDGTRVYRTGTLEVLAR